MKINILALDNVFDTGLATIQDTFTTANELAQLQGIDAAGFDVTVLGLQKTVKTAQGHTVSVTPIRQRGEAEWTVVPAIGYKMPGPLQLALDKPNVKSAVAMLREDAAMGVKTAAACIGTFVLAESGLLDGQAATTTWWLAPMFRQRYPQVKLDESRMLVQSGNFYTAGAALSHIDLALSIVRQQSPELATLVAKYLIVDSRPSQSSYVISHHLSHSDPLVEAFERWARARLTDGFSLDDAADALATSKRTLGRRMQSVLGKTPLAFFQDLRVEYAVHLLKTSNHNIDHIATQVGYADGVTLRTLLRRKLGRGVRDIRSTE